jgi:hypothetical protein
MLSMLPSIMPLLVAAVAVPAIVAVFVARPVWAATTIACSRPARVTSTSNKHRAADHEWNLNRLGGMESCVGENRG